MNIPASTSAASALPWPCTLTEPPTVVVPEPVVALALTALCVCAHPASIAASRSAAILIA
jgi:hypothetical protein